MGRSKTKSRAMEEQSGESRGKRVRRGRYHGPYTPKNRHSKKGAPQPGPNDAIMDTDSRNARKRRLSWEQYASCKTMNRFGDLKSSPQLQGSHSGAKERNILGQKQQLESSPTANAPTHDGPEDKSAKGSEMPPKSKPDAVPANSAKATQHVFGQPSSPYHKLSTSIGMSGNSEKMKVKPSPGRTLDDLYREHPQKQLPNSFIESRALSLATEVIFHVANESTHRWMTKWCPQLNLREVFQATYAEGKEDELIGNPYRFPHQAIDTKKLTTTLANMYNDCRSARMKALEDFEFPKLLKLIDVCADFVSVLKDDEVRKMLQKTRSTFQWLPVRIHSKKYFIRDQAATQLKEVHKSNMNRREKELHVLDTALADFNVESKALEVEVLEWLKVLLASTSRSSLASSLPEASQDS